MKKNIIIVSMAVALCLATVGAIVWITSATSSPATPLGAPGVVAKNFAQEQLEKRRLSRFFSPNVVKEIVRQKDDAGLGASRRRMTVLFSDIVDSTRRAEAMGDRAWRDLLDAHATDPLGAVQSHSLKHGSKWRPDVPA